MIWTVITGLFKVLIGAYEKRTDQAHELKLDLIETDRLDMKNRSMIIQKAMSVKTFWFAWALFAFPLGFWWCAVMLDTMTPPEWLDMGIPMLPQTIRPYADLIFNSLFYSGAGVAGTQSVVRGVLNVVSNKS
jgi:hypothetical protein